MRGTTSFTEISKLKHKVKVIQGSQGAGKTYSILQRWIILAMQSNAKELCTIISDTLPNLRTGAIKDFTDICNTLGVNYRQIKSPYEFHINGWKFEFFGVDKENKGLGGRRDRLFINEANRLEYKLCRQLIARTHKECIFDFNPAVEFWAHTEYVYTGSCDFLKLTYKQNECLPQSEIESIERHAPWGVSPDENYWRVYGLGELGFVEGMIFKGYKTYDTLPDAEYQTSIGVDFGWQDPLTAIRCFVDHKAKRIYWHELFYASQASYDDFMPSVKPFNDVLFCDHSPRDVLMLRGKGLKAMQANKKNGISADIRTIKQYELFVHSESKNLIYELDRYKYQVKNGQIIDYPETNQSDHAIDAARYATTGIIKR